jgi:leader peptidase (prepilin peptidase)/N-methyltransferase
MGLGDVKLGGMLGAWLGWQMGTVTLFVAIVAGAIGGISLVVLQQQRVQLATERSGNLRIPFGTFLAAAGILTVFTGSPLLRWYLSFFPR